MNAQHPVVAIGSIMHESNSFNPAKTRLADFHFRQETDVDATLRNWSAGNTEVAGMLEEATRAGFQLRPAIYAAATPRGPVDAEAFEELCARLLTSFKNAMPLDGVLLALHGAMYAEKFPHADEEIVRRVRRLIGRSVPLIVTHDFHANIPPGIVELCDALVTYQQTPHIDTRERGIRAASILARMLKGEVKPRQCLIKPPMFWNLVFQNTFDEPLLPITQASMELERQPGVLAASVAGGYQYGDVPWMGPSVVVVTDGDAELAEREARRLAGMMWDRRDALQLNLPNVADAVRGAIESDRFPVALFDVGDNVGGGTAGDETGILEELLRQNARGWALVLYDPAAVEAAKSAGIDGSFEMAVGGRAEDTNSKPVPVQGIVRSLHHGRYVETEVRHGGQRYWDMGHSAVIEVKGSTPDDLNLLILTAERSSPNSLHQLIGCGVYPERQKILVAKGTIAPRAAYEPVAARIVMVDTPGYTSVNPARFVFKNVRPGVWGLNTQ